MASNTRIVLQDLDLRGREDSTAQILIYEDDLAVSNALVAWLTSRVGDYIYLPTIGGPLDVILGKLMTTNKTEELSDYFKDVIRTNFGGVMDVTNVVVDPNFTNNEYDIEISYRSLITNNNNLVQFSTKPPQGQNIPEFSDVNYVGETLTNFVKLKLLTLPGIMMTKDDLNDIYVWGPYRFINLKNTDYNFNTILRLTQGR